MRDVEQKMIERATALLESGEVARVVGWKKGEFYFDPTPAVFETVAELKDFVYNGFCGANLSKYLIQISKKDGKTAIFMKPCDSYSFNQLVKEHRIDREKIYVIAVECQGKLDIEKIKANGVTAVTEVVENGDKVKVSIRMKGRQQARPEMGVEIMNNFAQILEAVGTVEKKPEILGKNIFMIMVPVKK